MKRTPIAALAVAFAVLWVALWPLSGALHDAWSGEAVPLCHQAGMQVEAGSMPLPVGDVPARKTHCPLCVMVFFGSVAATVAVPAYAWAEPLVVRIAEGVALSRRFAVLLPFGRAPPIVPVA